MVYLANVEHVNPFAIEKEPIAQLLLYYEVLALTLEIAYLCEDSMLTATNVKEENVEQEWNLI